MLNSTDLYAFVMARSVPRKKRQDNQDKFFLYVIFFHLFTALANIFKD